MTTETDVQVDYKRQSQIASPEKMAAMPVTIIGMGTTGSHAAYQLARLGTKRFHLVDDDSVEAHNFPSQQFDLADIGRYKAEAARDQLERITNNLNITLSLDRLEGGERLMEGIVVFGVDNVESRESIFDLSCEWQPHVKRVIDVRMAGNHVQTFCFDPTNENEVKTYRLLAVSNDMAHELPCGGESVSYVGAFAGGMVANLVRQIVMGEPVPFGLTWNLGTWDLRKPKPSTKG